MKQLSLLRWAAELNGLPTIVLKDVGKAIRLKMAQRPKKKARPLSARQTRTLISSVRHRSKTLATVFWLAWVTSSRIDDVTKLHPRAFNLNETHLAIDFRFTKMNPTAQPREDQAYAVARSLVPGFVRSAIKRWPEDPKQRNNLKSSIRNQLLKIPITLVRDPIPGVEWNTHFTLHSFKMGAADALLLAAANGEIPTRVLSLAMKHKRQVPEIEPTSVGYVANTLNTARATQMDKATNYLARLLRFGDTTRTSQ